MRAGRSTAGEPRWTRDRASVEQGPALFVRLAHLRKLRECAQVAAVCYRVRDAGIEFLLVQTRGSGRWTFPKGSVEPGLTHAQAAALEAFEEAGVHGRIEDVSFARYVLRKRGNARKSISRPAEKELAVNAHLCEVLRLGTPEEPNRERTWFSAKEARRRLREDRDCSDGAALGRVIDKALARIQRLRCTHEVASNPASLLRTQPYTPQRDPLQKVHFDFAEAGRSMSLPNVPTPSRDMQRLAVPVAHPHSREILQCDVLPFDRPRELNRNPKYLTGGKKTKALGTGSKGA